MLRLLPLVLASAVASGAAFAQDDARYRLEKSGERFVRMDTRTGDMSICEDTGGRLECRGATVGATSPAEAEVEARIDALEARIAALETAGTASSNLPSDQEFERTLTFMEGFFRRFIGIAKELEQDNPPPPAAAPLPDRT